MIRLFFADAKVASYNFSAPTFSVGLGSGDNGDRRGDNGLVYPGGRVFEAVDTGHVRYKPTTHSPPHYPIFLSAYNILFRMVQILGAYMQSQISPLISVRI